EPVGAGVQFGPGEPLGAAAQGGRVRVGGGPCRELLAQGVPGVGAGGGVVRAEQRRPLLVAQQLQAGQRQVGLVGERGEEPQHPPGQRRRLFGGDQVGRVVQPQRQLLAGQHQQRQRVVGGVAALHAGERQTGDGCAQGVRVQRVV